MQTRVSSCDIAICMAGIIRILILLFATIALVACVASERLRIPEHLDANALAVKKTRRGHVVENIVKIRPSAGARSADRLRTAPLITSHSEHLSINIFSPSGDIAFDPMLLELAMNQVQQDWQRLENKYTNNPLSIDLWIVPEGESFQYENKVRLYDDEPLHLTFAVSPTPGKPTIDTLAEAVDTLSHELYHVSRIVHPNEDALAEEINATSWGFCSKIRFALAANNDAVFRFHVNPRWQGVVTIKQNHLLVRVPRDAKNPMGRSVFGTAVTYQYLTALIGSDNFQTKNPDHIAKLFDVCEVVRSSQIRIQAQ